MHAATSILWVCLIYPGTLCAAVLLLDSALLVVVRLHTKGLEIDAEQLKTTTHTDSVAGVCCGPPRTEKFVGYGVFQKQFE